MTAHDSAPPKQKADTKLTTSFHGSSPNPLQEASSHEVFVFKYSYPIASLR